MIMSLQADFNPFQSLQVEVLAKHKKYIDIYSRKNLDESGKQKKIYDSPFSRYIDVWAMAMLIGRATQSYVDISILPSKDRDGFIPGTIFARRLNMIELILILAIDRARDHEIVLHPKDCLNIASGYAAGGMDLLVESMTSSSEPSIDLLCDYLRDNAEQSEIDLEF